MYKIQTFVGDLEVVKDGIVHVSDGSKLNIKINNLDISFEFLTDNNIHGHKIERDIQASVWNWKLTNFDNSLGMGMLEPIEMGSLLGNKLYGSFYVWTPNFKEGLRIINYVIYSKKP